ncbi:MAG: guanylate kinase [Candidatus Moranbacteria bacterium]|nr:guanylate kinase [Candidatus Moranbacteria bacterium]
MSTTGKKLNLFIISGPSGAGEDSIISGLKKYFPIERVITTATRLMRPGESQSKPYYFISRDEFQKKIGKGDFIEYAKEYNNNFYGTEKKELERVKNSGRVGIWKIEYQGVITAKNLFPEIPVIFITVSNLKILEDRIRRRDGVSEEYIKERMEYTKQWMKHKDIYDYKVVNEEGKLDEAIAQTAEIIKNHVK